MMMKMKMTSKDDDDDDDEIKRLNDLFDEIIDKSKSFEDQIKFLKKVVTIILSAIMVIKS